jgi:Tol biopolymer transport system component
MSQTLISKLEILTLATLERKVIFEAPFHFEAPNWSLNGQWLIFNSLGLLYKIPVGGGTPVKIDTGFANRCNNDHVLSPDGKEIAVSHHDEDRLSKIYILPIDGGMPRQVTSKGPSYLHGWSPDGTTLAYCAERNGQYDIYTISVKGGEEKQLTNVPGLDDGPEYSPDGNYIYFNSERTGLMQIWRMRPDGSQQQQLTFDDSNNWFAHVSPDGKHFVFLTYNKDIAGHPANKDVRLRIMPYNGGEAKTVATLFGGQGTINVNSWSPDSTKVAFVSYSLV